jgi:RNA polymerase sigma-70 factor (ECF subfamily)
VSDEELIERARSGDRAAFGDLVERYQQAVFRAALAALRSREDAEEVAQDTFVAAYSKLEHFRGDSSFKTWLLSIAWNRALDRRRSVGEWFKRFVSRDAQGESAASHGGWSGSPHPRQDPASAEPSHEQALIDDEKRREVRRLVRTLPDKYRDALLLSASGDHTFEEIAALLRIPVGTAKWRAMEGRRLLKKKLESGLPTAAPGTKAGGRLAHRSAGREGGQAEGGETDAAEATR